MSVDDDAIKELKDALGRQLGSRLRKMVLYGSRARGDFDTESDIDIAVIVRELTRELKHQVLDTVAEIELKYLTPLSVIIFSENEFEQLKRRERRIALDIEREGVPL
ncbi:MAG: nucleotidyltransferase domain-containing protein [Thermodesulfobacteriota bacterium]